MDDCASGAIVINELLAMPNGTLAQLQAGTGAVSWTGIAAVTKWFELLSIGAATTDSSSASKSAVDLSGYTVTAGPRTGKGAAGLGDLYQIPADFRLPAGAFLVVMCPQQRGKQLWYCNICYSKNVPADRLGIFAKSL